MHPKARFLLAAVISMLLCLPAPACSHDNQPEGDGEVDWGSFVPIERDTKPSPTIEQAEETIGFRLVLPSYLPEGMGRSYYLSFALASADGQPPSAGLWLFPANPLEPEPPQITIDQTLREPDAQPLIYTGRETVKVANREVACVLEVGPGGTASELSTPEAQRDIHQYGQFRCGWETDKLQFDVEFLWRLPEAMQEDLAPEMRDEAMKVIASMIEDPYIP